MEHTEIRRRLSDYLDNVVSATEKSEIETHLAACENCRAALADLQRTIAHMKSLPDVEPPPWLTAKIMARVKEGAEPRPALWKRLFFPLYVKLPLEALALVFLCVTGYYLARTTAPQVALTESPPVVREEPAKPSEATPSERQSIPAPGIPMKPSAVPEEPVVAPPSVNEKKSHAQPPIVRPAVPAPASPAYLLPPSGTGPAADRSVQKVAPRVMEFPLQAPGPQIMKEEAGEEKSLRGMGGQHDGTAGMRGSPDVMETSPSASAPAKRAKKAMTSDKSRRGSVDITLLVDDPVAAVGSVEEGVTRAGGSIVRRTYGEATHQLLVRIESRLVPVLVARLERVGVVQIKPGVEFPEGETVELLITW